MSSTRVMNATMPNPLPNISERLRGQGSFKKSEVSQLLQSIDMDMRNVSSEILRLQSIILSLRAKREQLEKLRADAQSLTAPIRRLPVELLTRIFSFYCSSVPSNFSTSRSKRHLKDAPPFVLGTVCARWYDIVRSLPSLWSNLALNLCPSDKESNSITPPVEFHLKRSQQHPLTLDIEMWLHSNSEQEHLLMYTIARHSRRWEHITIRTGILSVECYNSLASLGPLPCLRSLRISQTLNGESVDELPNLSLFEDAPCLTQLAVNCTPNKSDPTAAGFPWTQITDMELDAGSPTVFRALEFCPGLESVSYTNAHHDFAGENDISRNPSDVVKQTSKTLRSLSISVLGKPKVPEHSMLDLIISSLTTPSLTAITIKSESTTDPRRMYDGPWPGVQLADFINRSRCTITTLRLECIPLSEREAITLLELLPALEDLAIIEALPPSSNLNASRRSKYPLYTPTICRTFFEALHRCGHLIPKSSAGRAGSSQGFGSGSTLVPKLKRLELGARSSSFDDDALISMLVSRWVPEPLEISEVGVDGVECLRFVRLQITGRTIGTEARRELEYLEHAGLTVEICEVSGSSGVVVV